MHLRQLPSVRDDGLDSILCAGQFRAVLLLHNGQVSFFQVHFVRGGNQVINRPSLLPKKNYEIKLGS